jgi:hypothetical protein
MDFIRVNGHDEPLVKILYGSVLTRYDLCSLAINIQFKKPKGKIGIITLLTDIIYYYLKDGLVPISDFCSKRLSPVKPLYRKG